MVMVPKRFNVARTIVIVVAMGGMAYAMRLNHLTEFYKIEAERHASLAEFRAKENERLEVLARQNPERADLARQVEQTARQAEYHRELQFRYEYAASHPWQSLAPDPEPP
jgi:hypothetical protein